MNETTIEKIQELTLTTDYEIYTTVYEDIEFIYRPLTFKEYNALTDLEDYLDGPEINDLIIIMCTLYPDKNSVNKWLDTAKAVIPDNYAQEILDMSGFDNEEVLTKLLDESRKNTENMPALIEIYVCSVFKSVSPKDLRNMTLKEQLDLFAKAETVIGKKIELSSNVEQSLDIPVPQGMETTDPTHITESKNYSTVKFDEIFQGKQVY